MTKFPYLTLLLGLILLSIWPINDAIAQAQQSDSLLLMIEQTTDKKEKVDLYNQLAKLHSENSITKTQKYTQLAHQLAVEIQYPFGEAQSLFYKSNSLSRNGQYQASLPYKKEALAIIRKVPNAREREAKYLLALGWVYEQLSQYFKGLSFYMESYEIYNSIKDKQGMAMALVNTGSIHRAVGDQETALTYFYKAKTISEQSNEKYPLLISINNIGSIYEERGDFSMALDYYKKASNLAEEINKLSAVAIIQTNIGDIYVTMNKLIKARANYQKALQIHLGQNNKVWSAEVDIKMAKVEFLQSKDCKSISSLEKAYETGKDFEIIELQQSSVTSLSEMYAHQGLYEKAYEFNLLANQLQDSITNKEILQKIKSVEFKKQLEQKEEELAQEKKEAIMATSLAYQKNIRNILLFFLGVLALGGLYLYRAYKTTNRIKEQLLVKNNDLEKAEERLEEKNEDLQRYIEKNVELEQFAYIASHDIKAPLRTIASFSGILKKKFYESAGAMEKNCFDFVEKSAKSLNLLVEDLLEFSRSDSKNLHVEKLSLKAILGEVVENLEFSVTKSKGKINLINCDYDINADQIKVKQIIQNLMSNALKFRAPDRAPILNIKARDDKDFLYISVEDNGIGIPEENFEEVFQKFARLKTQENYEGSGLGLSIVAKYIKKHEGDIWIERNEGYGVTFSFTIKKDLPLSVELDTVNKNNTETQKVVTA